MGYTEGSAVEFLAYTKTEDPYWATMIGQEWTPALVLRKHEQRDIDVGCKPYFVRTLDGRCGPADDAALRPRNAFARSVADVQAAITLAMNVRVDARWTGGGDESLRVAMSPEHPLETRFFMAYDAIDRYLDR